MSTNLLQLQKRIEELEALANSVFALADELRSGKTTQPELEIKGQQWYRGVRELLQQHNFSGAKEFEDLFYGRIEHNGRPMTRGMTIDRFIGLDPGASATGDFVNFFSKPFQKGRALLLSLEEEILSRELPVLSQLSFAISASELVTAETLLAQHGGNEAILRASGVVARVALERHLFCVINARSIPLIVNPSTKKKPDVEDALNTLVKANVITAVQKAHFDSLFKVANNCAHPKEAVTEADVIRLIRDGKAAAAAVR